MENQILTVEELARILDKPVKVVRAQIEWAKIDRDIRAQYEAGKLSFHEAMDEMTRRNASVIPVSNTEQ